MHWRARRLLAALPDASLPEETEVRVRSHVNRCARCRRAAREFERIEGLVRCLPKSLVPEVACAGSDERLGALARWAVPTGLALGERWQLPAVSAATALAVACMMFALGATGPMVDPHSSRLSPLTSAIPEVSLIPHGWGRAG